MFGVAARDGGRQGVGVGLARAPSSAVLAADTAHDRPPAAGSLAHDQRLRSRSHRPTTPPGVRRMTVPLRHGPDDPAGWHVRDDDPFVSGARLSEGLDPDSVSRYGADRWILNALNLRAHEEGRSVAWDAFPAVFRESFRRAGWALTNLPTPEELLERASTARAKWPAPGTVQGVVGKWRQFARWLVQRGIADLRDVEEDILVDYARHAKGQGRS